MNKGNRHDIPTTDRLNEQPQPLSIMLLASWWDVFGNKWGSWPKINKFKNRWQKMSLTSASFERVAKLFLRLWDLNEPQRELFGKNGENMKHWWTFSGVFPCHNYLWYFPTLGYGRPALLSELWILLSNSKTCGRKLRFWSNLRKVYI